MRIVWIRLHSLYRSSILSILSIFCTFVIVIFHLSFLSATFNCAVDCGNQFICEEQDVNSVSRRRISCFKQQCNATKQWLGVYIEAGDSISSRQRVDPARFRHSPYSVCNALGISSCGCECDSTSLWGRKTLAMPCYRSSLSAISSSLSAFEFGNPRFNNIT